MNADFTHTRRRGNLSILSRPMTGLVLGLIGSAVIGALPARPAAGADGEKPEAKPAARADPTTKPKPTTKPAAATQPAPKPGVINDGGTYTVSGFDLSYHVAHDDHPPLEPFAQIPIELGKTSAGYVMPRQGVTTETIRLAEVAGPQVFFASAIKKINEEIVKAFNRQGLVGIFVAPHTDDIDPTSNKDKRSAGSTRLRLVVWSATVSRVRTLASGQRVPEDDRIDHPLHQRIRDRSPVQEGDLLRRDWLDDYVFFLSRHPGRRADVAVTAGAKAGEVALDYLVSENKPWLVYAQASNTGTEVTSKCRYRFGFVHNQVTGNDDVLAGEYVTSGFDAPDVQSASGSYEAPFFGIDRLRWKVYGSWGDFEASLKGGPFGQNFTGYDWRIGGEMALNVYQKKQLFLDVIGGATWWHLLVENEQTGITGDADLFMPHVGVKVERITELAATVGSATVQWNCAGVTSDHAVDLEPLGRTEPDDDWVTINWDFLQTFFIEPLINPDIWQEAAKREKSPLAHEMAFHFRGQSAMNGYRLIPQKERVLGGFFSVRGYPESATAGDTAFVATTEYRLHIPRLLKVRPPSRTILPLVGTPFRWAPQTVYGRPDWDLIFRTFFDIGRAMHVNRMVQEKDFTLMGAGVGIEIQFTRHINLRCDWGMALRDLDSASQTVQGGDHRFYCVATVLY